LKILLLQLKRIGDAILTAPAVSALRLAMPDARIELELHGSGCQLAPMFHRVDKVWCYSPRRANVGLWSNLAMAGYDGVLDFTGSERSRLQLWLTRARVRAAYLRDVPACGWGKYAANTEVQASVREMNTVDYHLALVDGFLAGYGMKMPNDIPGPHLHVPEGVAPDSLPERYAVVHPGTARDEKYWPAERWAEVIGELVATHSLPVVITGSAEPREQSYLDQLRSCLESSPATVREAVHDMSGKMSLLQTAAVIGNAAVLLSVDSAAMHFGSQFAMPQVALFGPTNPFHWAPHHPDARILLASAPGAPIDVASCPPRHAKAGMEKIPVSSVVDAVAGLL